MLGSRIEALIAAQDKQQKTIAIEWLDAFDGSGDWKPDSIISQLSRLVNEKHQGVRFFFEDPARSRALFDVLGVDDQDEADSLRALADDLLDPTSQPPRIVVDLTRLAIEKDGLGGRIAARFLTEALESRLAFVLTEAQEHHLTLTYARARREKVPDETHAPKALAGFAEAGALVIGPERDRLPLSKWAALDASGDRVTLDPPDAEKVYLREGALPVPAAPAHPLADIASELPADRHAERWRGTPANPVTRRRLMVRLPAPDDAMARYAPAERLRMAAELGVTAGGTDEEARVAAERRADRLAREAHAAETKRLKSRLEAAGLPTPSSVDADALAAALDRAKRRPVTDQVWMVGDVFHAVNPTDEALAEAVGPRLTVHAIECPVPAIRPVRARVGAMTAESFAQDPLLVGLVTTMAAEGTYDERSLRHAADTLLVHPQFEPPVPGDRVAAPVDPVRTLLAEPCPAAEVKIRQPGEEKATRDREWSDYDSEYESRDTRHPAATWPGGGGWTFCGALTPRYAGWLDRSWGVGRAVTAREFRVGWGRNTRRDEHFTVRPSFDLTDEAAWLDALEQAHARQTPALEDVTQESPETWQAADLHLALLWDALRRAWDRETPTPLHDGRWLIPLGGGLVARFSVRVHPGDAVRGALLLPDGSQWSAPPWSSITRTLPVWHATFKGREGPDSMQLGAELPHGVVLTGRGVAVELDFAPSPYRQGSPFG